MQEVFQPTHQEDQLVLYIAVILAIAGIAGLVFTLRKKASGDARNRNMLVAMLLFFLATISTGTAFFSWLSMRKTGPVTITEEAIETPYGKAVFTSIRKAEIITDQPVRLIPSNNQRGAVKLLVIEEESGKAHVMSEENYDIQRIFGALREAME
jgi:hypothetical protein